MKGIKALFGGILFSLAALAWAEVDINSANAEELQSLSGIGSVKARAIVEYREANGGFDSAAELTAVDGIGDKTLESIRGDVTVGGAD